MQVRAPGSWRQLDHVTVPADQESTGTEDWRRMLTLVTAPRGRDYEAVAC